MPNILLLKTFTGRYRTKQKKTTQMVSYVREFIQRSHGKTTSSFPGCSSHRYCEDQSKKSIYLNTFVFKIFILFSNSKLIIKYCIHHGHDTTFPHYPLYNNVNNSKIRI